MSKNEPVDARIRLAISQWPPDAPRGSVTTFCTEHGISRKTFYAIRARAKEEGQAAALEPRSRRPHTSPTRIADDIKQQALGVRAALESSGLDHGPISVPTRCKPWAWRPRRSRRWRGSPPGGRGASRAEEEAPGRLPALRLPRT